MKLKKNSFMQGAFVATLGIVISKIIGIFYVIPFYSIIGDKGGALYGYAYSIYAIFLGISNAGIPLAMSKVVSEYDALGYNDLKKRAFKLGSKILNIIGIICFLIMVIFAKPIAFLIIGNVQGGNTIEDITLVIRLISLCLLVVPILSVYRGYLQGHRYFSDTSISQVLEQIIRVTIILLGTYICRNVFSLSLSTTVAIAVFAAFPSSLISWLYLRKRIKKNKNILESSDNKTKEPKISNKKIIKTIIEYSIPFIMIEVFRSLYNSIDVVLLVKVLVNGIGYTANYAEGIMGIISTWGNKINMIVIAVGTGVVSSLIPNISASFVKNDIKDVNEKINKALQMLLYVTLPMVVGLSFLSKPVWNIFYGNSSFGPSVYKMFVFVALATVFFTSSITIVQIMKNYKQVFITLIIGFLTNAILDIPMLYLFNYLGLKPYYGSIISTILGYSVATIISLCFLHKKYNINYKETFARFFPIILSTICMFGVLKVVEIYIPYSSLSRFMSIIYVLFFSLIGILVYGLCSIKFKLISKVFGNETAQKIKTFFKGE